jgi:hypothetical protein
MLDDLPAYVLVDVLKHLSAVELCRCELVHRTLGISASQLGSSPTECAAQMALRIRHPQVNLKILPCENWKVLLFLSDTVSNSVLAARPEDETPHVGWMFGLGKDGEEREFICGEVLKVVSARSWWRAFVKGYKTVLERLHSKGFPPAAYLPRQVYCFSIV